MIETTFFIRLGKEKESKNERERERERERVV